MFKILLTKLDKGHETNFRYPIDFMKFIDFRQHLLYQKRHMLNYLRFFI